MVLDGESMTMEHKRGCPALGGYGHGVEECACQPSKQHNKVLIIIRGLPGSGKSTLAAAIEDSIKEETYDDVIRCEADNFFTDSKGNYNFIKEELPQAHRWCYNICKEAMEYGYGTVIVSNTSCSRGEYARYIDLARQHDYAIQVIDVHGEFESVHGVPPETMDKMNERWEPFDRSLLA
jgi:adenylylsulfate kinase-like enzyme